MHVSIPPVTLARDDNTTRCCSLFEKAPKGFCKMNASKLIPLLPVIAGIMWGSVGVFVRFLTAGGLDNGTIVCTRMLVSAIVLGLFMLVKNRELFKFPKKAIPMLLIGAIIGSAYMNVMYNIAILQLHLALSSVLLGMFALWAIFLGCIFFKEKLTVRKIVCVVLALFGVLLVSGALEQTDISHVSLFGVAIGLTAALMYAINGVTTRVMGNWGMDALTINFYYFLIAAISLLPLCHWDQVVAYVAASPASSIAWLVSQSLVCAIIPYVLFTIALNNMDIGIASTLELIEPAAGMVFGFVLFGENPTVLMVIGVAVVIFALSMTYRSPRKTSPEE